MVDPSKSANVTNEKEEIQNGSIDTSEVIETNTTDNVADQTQQNDIATEVISEIQNTTESVNVIEETQNATGNDSETQQSIEDIIDQSEQAQNNESTEAKDTMNSGNVTNETVDLQNNSDDTSIIVETESQGSVTDVNKEGGGGNDEESENDSEIEDIQTPVDVTNEKEETENVSDSISQMKGMQNDINDLKDVVAKLSSAVNYLEEGNKLDKIRISDLEKDVGNFYCKFCDLNIILL